MYNEQLESLIEMALVDGQITDKERSVLIKKAESFGIDLDEFEMVLDARLFEKQKTQKANSESPKQSTSNKSDKHGDVKKCPACGSLIQNFKTSCPDCGHDFSGIKANASIEKLFTMLTDVENKRNDEISFYSNNTTSSKSPLMHFFVERYKDAYKNQLYDFAKFIKKNVKPLALFEEGRRALIMANAAKKSITSKRIEKLNF